MALNISRAGALHQLEIHEPKVKELASVISLIPTATSQRSQELEDHFPITIPKEWSSGEVLVGH